MKVGFWKRIGRAFNLMPGAMFVPPNWLGIIFVGLVGCYNPAFWVIGAGLELAYLLMMANSESFKASLDQEVWEKESKLARAKIASILDELSTTQKSRYNKLQASCQSILQNGNKSALEADALNKLLWVYLSYLRARQEMERMMNGSNKEAMDLSTKMTDLETRLERQDLSDELRNSLTSQFEILKKRYDNRLKTKDRYELLSAELTRIEEQVEWSREQSLMVNDPSLASTSLDTIQHSLASTAEWMKEKREIFGGLEDELSDAPCVLRI